MPKSLDCSYNVYVDDVKIGEAPTYSEAFALILPNNLDNWAIYRTETIEQLVSSSELEQIQ